MQNLSLEKLPTHLAIIMDGSRRWARQHGLAAFAGHQKIAKEIVRQLVDHCISLKIPYLTLWAFSTENWKRSDEEVGALLSLFHQAFEMNADDLTEKGIRLRSIGDLSRFPKEIQESVRSLEEKSKKNTKITVTFALNYGGRDEIVRAVKKLIKTGLEVSEEALSQSLDTQEIPDPDLIIRPGGEQRLSGFLPWQSVYSEWYFSPILMPDFGPPQLNDALAEYQQRQRRFGS